MGEFVAEERLVILIWAALIFVSFAVTCVRMPVGDRYPMSGQGIGRSVNVLAPLVALSVGMMVAYGASLLIQSAVFFDIAIWLIEQADLDVSEPVLAVLFALGLDLLIIGLLFWLVLTSFRNGNPIMGLFVVLLMAILALLLGAFIGFHIWTGLGLE